MPEDDNTSKWREYFSSHIIFIFIILTGIILVAIGFFFLFKSSSSDDKIEIIPAAQEKTSEKIQVDIEGAVIKPGVYELSFSSRLNDLLILAGGLSAAADREWTEKNLNKAQKLKDGDKIYIPEPFDSFDGAQDKSAQGKQESKSSSGVVSGSSTTVSSKININSATLSQLDTLWGVGLVIGQKIIDNRPYQKTEDLVTKKIISQSTYQKIVNQLSVY